VEYQREAQIAQSKEVKRWWIESKKANAITVRRKIRAGLPATLEGIDIIRIVNIAWHKSFARVDTNLKAISERGGGATLRASGSPRAARNKGEGGVNKRYLQKNR
jgi:hypothetical protein